MHGNIREVARLASEFTKMPQQPYGQVLMDVAGFVE
jgi:hypothetical protein